MKIGTIKTDVALVEGGDWVSGIPEMGDLRLRVRGLGNADFRNMQQRLIAAVPRAKRTSGMSVKDQDQIMSECLLHTILVDWDCLTDDDGTPIPYSKDAARPFLFAPEFAAFRDAVVWAATVLTDEREADREAAAKN